MPLFNRGARTQESTDNDQAAQPKKEKGGWRRPANTAFKQQRLKAWQPILTPKTVLPTLFIIGIIFAPIGGLLVWGSSLVSELTFDYTNCEKQNSQSPTNDLASLNYTQMPYTYRLRASDSKASVIPPQYAFINSSDSSPQCIIKFDIPADLPNPVLLYYKLTNFYQNHRRYVKSLDSNQLKGKYVSPNDLDNGNCKPLAIASDGRAIYPCGLIANSFFNDSFSDLTAINDTSLNYTFSQQGIAWPGESKKYASVPDYPFDQIVPPPNWVLRFPQGYSESTPPPNLRTDEHFQNWMRTAGLPTFSKLWGRNDSVTLRKGTYLIKVDLNFPVLSYSGTKSIVISTVSWIGGKNPFLGWAYVAAASVFVLLAIAGTARHLLKPRRLGDMSLLSWNRP